MSSPASPAPVVTDSAYRSSWNFHFGGRLLFGRGAVRETGAAVQRLGARRVLVVTDPILEKVGLVGPVLESIRTKGIEPIVFNGGSPEPSFAIADAAIAFARDVQPDAILGLGGGSNMDLAKVTAVVQSHGLNYRELFGFDRIPGPLLPLICIPTTAGTGSEVSHSTVLTDTDNRIKLSMQSHFLRPRLAIVDPELTLGCPKKASADSGIDALTHAIEAYTATHFPQIPAGPGEMFPYEGKNPMGDLFAERAIQLIGRHLVSAVEEPQNIDAREGMALAATLAGVAFSNCGVALVHAMEYPVGGVVHCSHGEGNGLLLPHVMRFTKTNRVPEFARIALLLGVDVSGLSEDAAADWAIAKVDELRARIGVPGRLRELGVREESLPELARKAHDIKRLMIITPRSPSYADVLAIYRDAW
jgi:alcohol dehydrogenase class IV